MKNVIAIYAQRADNREVWEEPHGNVGDYSGNTIAVSQNAEGKLVYDFSGCEQIESSWLDAFFRTVGVSLGATKIKVQHIKSIWDLMHTQKPSLN